MKKNSLPLVCVSRRLSLAVGLCLLFTASLPAQNLFDYGGTGSGFTLAQPRPTNNADVGTFGLALGPGQSFQVTQITVARAHGTTNGSFDVGFFLWNTVNTSAPAGTSIFSDLLFSGTFNRSVTAANQGQILTTNFTIAPGALLLTDPNFGYQMVYAAPGTINTTTAAFTPTTLGVGAFFQNHGPTAPASNSPNTFYTDADGDGIVEGSESTGFAAPNEAFSNVYLIIQGTVIPEPSTVALAAIGGFGLLLNLRRFVRRG